MLVVAAIAWPCLAIAACLRADYSVRAEYDRSAAVVIARVVSEHPTAESDGYYEGVRYTVAVERVYRGEISRTPEIFSENSSGRFPMRLRRRYVLFVHRERGRLMVDNCGNSGIVEQQAAVVRVLDRLAEPREIAAAGGRHGANFA